MSSPSKGDSYKVTLLSDFEVGQFTLATGLIILLVYNWLGFSREVRRVHHEASVAAKALEASDEPERGTIVLMQFDNAAGEMVKGVQEWSVQLKKASAKINDLEVRETEIEQTLPEISRELRELENKSIRIQQNVMAFFESTEGTTNLQKIAKHYEDDAKGLSEQIFKVSAEASHLASQIKSNDRDPDLELIYETENSAITKIEQLHSLTKKLSDISISFVNFADDLDGRDVRSHIFLDRFVPYGFATVAFGTCVWFKYEIALVSMRNWFVS
ncbi:hypothetical protein GCM10023115_10740 [Pontixanthobacter gangjinensis]|uniref:Uncharacterized protein n=1 Tax=Pontixanthobacter gangjinensis TaxID=1028742 RepID=A0A6I4SMH8_9SPHN|nr:hypothetical protein [Pontixanthobacter gangjinensis]MXO56320.1 hypothetical protein [Pontixanthobacter gangjinensis]